MAVMEHKPLARLSVPALACSRGTLAKEMDAWDLCKGNGIQLKSEHSPQVTLPPSQH